MCSRARCEMCGQVKLGLLMAWRVYCLVMETAASMQEDRQGHVCYGCEDRVCHEIEAGTTQVRWLDTIGGCE